MFVILRYFRSLFPLLVVFREELLHRFGLGKHLLIVIRKGRPIVVGRHKTVEQGGIELAVHPRELLMLLTETRNSSSWIGIDGSITDSGDIDLQTTVVPFKGIFDFVIDVVGGEDGISRSGDGDVIVDQGLDKLECSKMGFGGKSECSHDMRGDERAFSRKTTGQHHFKD